MKKVFIRGIKDRGSEVIAKLEALGGKNSYNVSGCLAENFYFINSCGDIGTANIASAAGTLLKWAGTEIFLNELKNGDPVLVSNEGTVWEVAKYKEKNTIYYGDENCPNFGKKYIVPFNEFDPNDLKGNIFRSIV